MKDRTKEQPPSIVPETAQQEGEIRARWAWVEPAVWTERMLATLETGIEGGKWFRLIDKVWRQENLARSLQKVVAKGGSAGIDNQSASRVGERLEQTIQKLEQELRTGQYQPQPSNGYGYPSLGAKSSDHWEYRRSGTGSCKEQCSKSSNRSSSENSLHRATGFDQEKGVRTRYAESMSCSRAEITGWWMQI